MSYLGTPPNEDIVCNTHEYTATKGQTQFDVVYDNYVEVFLNGVQLSMTDFTATDGLTINLVSGASAGDVVKVNGYENFKYNNTVNTINAQTIDGVKTFKNNPVIPDAVNNNEPLSRGQLVNSTPLAGSNADLVRGLPADFTSSKVANGYQKLPSGLIIQWGKTGATVIPGGGKVTITFPIAFPTAVLGKPVVSSISRTGYNVSTGNSGAEGAISVTSFDVSAEPGVTNGCSWIAIGY